MGQILFREIGSTETKYLGGAMLDHLSALFATSSSLMRQQMLEPCNSLFKQKGRQISRPLIKQKNVFSCCYIVAFKTTDILIPVCLG